MFIQIHIYLFMYIYCYLLLYFNITINYSQVKDDGNLSEQSEAENPTPDTVEEENAIALTSEVAQQDQMALVHSNLVTTVQRAFENDLQCHICYEIFIKVPNTTNNFI